VYAAVPKTPPFPTSNVDPSIPVNPRVAASTNNLVDIVPAPIVNPPVFATKVSPLTEVAVAAPTFGVVKDGEIKFAFRLSAVCCAVDTGFAVSAVLSTEPRPTIDFVIPPTVPVKVGDAINALVASCGVFVALVKLIEAGVPRIAPLGIVTVPVNVGLEVGALDAKSVTKFVT